MGSQKRLLLYLVIALVIFLVFSYFLPGGQKETTPVELSFDTFIEKVEQGEVISVVIYGMKIDGKFKDDKPFFTYKEHGYELTPLLINKKIPFKNLYDKTDPYAGIWGSLIQAGMWIGLILIAFYFISRYLAKRQGPGGTFGFGEAKVKKISSKAEKITFVDVAGIEEAKEEIQEIVDFLRDHKKFSRLGARIPRGVLLLGPSGVGKTLLARAMAGEAEAEFISISGSEFVEMFVGVGAARVRSLFGQARKSSPCIIFIDEIDAMGKQRGAGIGGGHSEIEQTLNQILVEMDGIEQNSGIIIIAATNRADTLDPALLRPGRFDRKISIPRPDMAGRCAILKVHTKKKKIADDVDLTVLARATPGFTGADLENLANEAALLAVKRERERIQMADFEDSVEKIYMGKKSSCKLIQEEKKTIALHEAGHAIVCYYLSNADPLYKVTIIPRMNGALGFTAQLSEEDRQLSNKSGAETTILSLLGGRVAEEILLGSENITTGASNDLKRATDIVRDMIAKYGMDEKFGLASFGEVGMPFLGKELALHSGMSQGMQEKIEERTRELLSEYHEKTAELLIKRKSDLEKLASELLEKETLTGSEIKKLLGEKN